MSDAYERLLTACHDAAEALHGKGTNISVDREGSSFLCRVWGPKGNLAFLGPAGGRNKAEACRKLKALLEKEERQKEKALKKAKRESLAEMPGTAPCTCGHVLDEHSSTGECQAEADGDYCACGAFDKACIT